MVGGSSVPANQGTEGMYQIKTTLPHIFITQRYPNLVEKATFFTKGFLVPNYFCFYLKTIGTNWVPKNLW